MALTDALQALKGYKQRKAKKQQRRAKQQWRSYGLRGCAREVERYKQRGSRRTKRAQKKPTPYPIAQPAGQPHGPPSSGAEKVRVGKMEPVAQPSDDYVPPERE